MEYETNDANTWAMAIHFSIFASYLIPLAGIVAPIVIWQVKKDQMPELDPHGKIVINAFLSFVIYLFAGIILSPFLIGIPIIWIVGLAAIVFPIIGGIKASSGEVWKYPLTIQFLR